MTGPVWRRAARFYFEPAPRTPMAHLEPMAHEVARPAGAEPLWKALIVYAAGILIGLAALYVLGPG